MAPLLRRLPAPRTTGSPVDDRIDLGEERPRSVLERMARALLLRVVGSRLGLAMLRAAMREPRIRAEILLFLSDRIAYGANFDAVLEEPGVRIPIRGFEDLVWLFSSNWMNHRLTRLDLDEAVYLYRLLHAIEGPRVAELGRFRGGTTVFFAACGAQVTSVDSHPLHGTWGPQLERALERLGLRDRVELVVGDTREHSPGTGPYDLVFFDASVRSEALGAEIRNWWPALAPGGHAIFRDGRAQLPHLVEVAREVDQFQRIVTARRLPDAQVPGSLVHLVKKQ